MKLSNLTITPKLGILVGVTLFGFSIAGAFAGHLMQHEPIVWLLGLAILGIAVVSGGIAWIIGRSISRPLDQLGGRMRALADGALEGEIPGLGRGDEIGAMAATVQIFKDNALRIRGLEKVEAETQARAAAERRWKALPATSSAASTASSVRCRPRRRECRPRRNP